LTNDELNRKNFTNDQELTFCYCSRVQSACRMGRGVR